MPATTVGGLFARCHQRGITSVEVGKYPYFLIRQFLQQVLSIAREVVIAWKNGLELEKLNKLEENYVRHHQFVAAVLGTDSVHSMLPHGNYTFFVTHLQWIYYD